MTRTILNCCFAACVLLPCSLTLAEDAGTSARRVPCGQALYYLGEAHDCYFTVETTMREWVPLVRQSIPIPSSVSEVSVDSLLTNALPGYVVIQSKSGVVYHIIQKNLLNRREYPLSQSIPVLDVNGSTGELCAKLMSLVPGFFPDQTGRSGLFNDEADFSTKISLSVSNMTVREILTDSLPLAVPSRWLWTVVSQEADGPNRSGCWFGGLVNPRPPELSAVLRGAPVSPTFAEFRGAKETSPEGIAKALACLSDRSTNSAERRWALIYLGKVPRATEDVVECLLRNIEYKYADHGTLADSYPAAGALLSLPGLPTATIARALETEPSTARKAILGKVLSVMKERDS